MINFFRKTRKKMADDNRPLKYMRYAIGEIVLVMLGILLALQVNNWNENRKTEIQELKYLERLKKDLVQDTLYFNQRIEILETAIESNTKAIKMAYQNQRDLKELDTLLNLYSFDSEHLTIQNNTYNELTNAGNFNIIQNEELKIEIIDLYRSSTAIDKHIKEYNEFSISLLTNLNTSNPFYKYYPYPVIRDIFDSDKMFMDSDWEFINDPSSYKFRILENGMLTYLTKHSTFVPYFNDLKSDSKSIIKLINNELKSRK